MGKKLQALNEVTSANDSDLLYLVRNTGGTYTDHKIAKSNLVDTVVPTKVSDLTNDSGFITAGDIPTIPSDISELIDSTGVIPANISDLTNDSGFITAEDIPAIPSDISELADSTGVIPDDISANVLLLDNTTEFTPDADYEPATKKYVDDNAGGVEANLPLRRTITYLFNDFDTDNVYNPLLVNSTIARTVYGGKITMGVSANDRCLIRIGTFAIPGLFDRNPSFTLRFNNYRMYNAPMIISIGNHTQNTYAKRFGWRTNSDTELYASNGDGSTAKETKLDTTFGSDVTRELTAKMNSGTNILYYVDGVLKATHTENLPTGDCGSNIFMLDITRDAGNNSYDLNMESLVIEYDAVV